MCTTTRINMEETGKNIARIRKEKGITVRQIQEAMGFNTPQAIFKWQKGVTLPSLENLIVLAELFNKTIDEIVVVVREA
ncbi:MAG: helix-turn-helix transcriptional regulator [Erysipelotrichaceae bacterium]|nr:helix-turn-helix transcriptional regulator [Erysipelotrichaceae bacterium]